MIVLFVPTNSGKAGDLQPIKISQFPDSVVPGAVKDVRIKKFRNLVAVDVQVPTLKDVLLKLTMLCTTPVRKFLTRPENSSVGLIRGVDVGLSEDIMKLITYPVQVQHITHW